MHLKLFLYLLLSLYCMGCRTKPEACGQASKARPPVIFTAADQEYAEVAGADLIRLLADRETRSKAFYELWRRDETEEEREDRGYADFLEDHYDPEVILCPQENGKPPLHVILYGFYSRHSIRGEEDYEIANPEELFPPLEEKGSVRSWTEPAIQVYSDDGREIDPFYGSNVLNQPGVMKDINGDGLVERVDMERYGLDQNGSCQVLEILVIKPDAPSLLAVLVNWKTDDWGYRLTDQDRDGIFDVELGPRVLDEIKPKAVFRWDKDLRRYEGPAGKAGDHFRVLNAQRDVFDEFKRLEKEKVVFPEDPDFVDERERRRQDGLWGRLGQRRPTFEELTKPYRAGSLRGLSNAEVMACMGEEKSEKDLEGEVAIKNHAPSNFWTLDPREAALVMAEENRYPDHGARYRLAVDARDGLTPPGTASVSIAFSSSRCYNAVDNQFVLYASPETSYLAFASAASGGVVFYNVINDQPAFDFRYCPLPYRDALQVAHVIWWLDRVRSLRVTEEDDFGSIGCTADGEVRLLFRDAAGALSLDRMGTLWIIGHASERWTAGYDHDVFLNFAACLMMAVLPERLGEAWTRFELRHDQDILSRQDHVPVYDPDETNRLYELTRTFLDLYSPDQARVPFGIVNGAVSAAGTLAFTNLAGRLADIKARFSSDNASRPTEAQLKAELDRLDKLEIEDYWKYAKERDRLYRELTLCRRPVLAEDGRELKATLDFALQQMSVADNGSELLKWACSTNAGSQWALQRLEKVDCERYVKALEWWMKNTSEEWTRQAYAAIAKSDSKRAAEIAAQVPAKEKGDLTLAAFDRLAETNGVVNREARIRTVIDIALDDRIGWEQRGQAVDLLVPPDLPFRYPSPEIDKALIKLLYRFLKGEYDDTGYVVADACRALASRGRTDAFDSIRRVLDKIDGFHSGMVLMSAAQLAQTDPNRLKKPMQDLLQAQWKRKDRNVGNLLMTAWGADLRDMKPFIESLATSGPGDYEDDRIRKIGADSPPVDGRYHRARKIASVWNEEDPLTRFRLLTAFGVMEAFSFVEEPLPVYRTQLTNDLNRTAAGFSPEQRKEAESFLDWCQKEQVETEKEPVCRMRKEKVLTLARDSIKRP